MSELLTDNVQTPERWTNHFINVLHRPANINDEAIARLPQVEVNHELDIPPFLEEVKKEIKEVACGKMPGQDAIHAEVYQAGGPFMLRKMIDLYIAYKYPYGMKKESLKNPTTPLSSIFAIERVTAKNMITIVETLSYPW